MVKSDHTYQHTHSNREFLPGYIRDLPVYMFRLYFFVKSGHPLFFSNVNPGMTFSGFVEVDKSEHLIHFDAEHLPGMFVASWKEPISSLEQKLKENNMSYPFIVKPNVVGRNGTDVEKIHNAQELSAYMQRVKRDMLVQELIDYPLELGVYYYRLPSEKKGHLTGIVGKDFLFVEGDGKSTLHELVMMHPRAQHYEKMFAPQHEKRWNSILPAGELVQLNYIGNHCKGAIFYDKSDIITPELIDMFDTISKKVPGFYCGRYDLKTKNIEEFLQGKFKILELNGVISEPTRMYDPSRSFRKAYKVMFQHRDIMYRIAKENRRRGHKYISLKEARKLIKQYGV